MFEALTDKLEGVFRRLSGKGRLSEKDVDEALREVRLALLEADVNFRVVKDFVARVRERAVGKEVLESLTPAQRVIKIVHDELVAVLGGGASKLAFASPPPTILILVGLQGSGKTTTAAKLALHLRRSGHRPLLAATDVRRPAAIEQLAVLGRQLDIPTYGEGRTALAIAESSLKRARELAATEIIIDTAGRLHIDEEMMQEVAELKTRLQPSEVLLVADAMTGQDAVRVAEAFQSQVGLTGLILTKMDGDARGGAALSMKAVTGVPIKFIGVGEKVEALEPFYPDRLASRILGMGDVVSLVEKVEATVDAQKAKKLEEKVRKATLDLEDFLEQLQEIKKMGSLTSLLEMVPGFSQVMKRLPAAAVDDKQVKKIEAIIRSMTPEERRRPELIDGSRRRRIARGSGTTPHDINQLLNQFFQMQKLMKELAQRKGKSPLPFLRL